MVFELSNILSNNPLGGTLQFDHVYSLATDTPPAALCLAWETSEEAALSCARKERPMTIREAGALAELHGIKLLDVLAI